VVPGKKVMCNSLGLRAKFKSTSFEQAGKRERRELREAKEKEKKRTANLSGAQKKASLISAPWALSLHKKRSGGRERGQEGKAIRTHAIA